MTAPGPEGSALQALQAFVRDEGGLLAGALRDDPALADGDLGALVAAGPRAQGARDELALVVEAVREGYLLHYGAARLFRQDDRDLALLAGDRLYALGLDRLAELGDLEAVAELADLIALSAQAQAEGRPDDAEAMWEAGVAAVGWGATDALRLAKDALRAADPAAGAALRAAARQARDDVAPVR